VVRTTTAIIDPHLADTVNGRTSCRPASGRRVPVAEPVMRYALPPGAHAGRNRRRPFAKRTYVAYGASVRAAQNLVPRAKALRHERPLSS
jgi:hypothetical protein